jgi:trehalose 6-phosphate phosphatase
MPVRAGLPPSLPRLPPPPRCWAAERPWAMFLDLDGTLCLFEDDPGNVRLSQAQKRLLTDLHARLGGALVIMSGRSQADLGRIVAGLPLQHIGDHGQHGDAALAPAVRRQLDKAELAMRKLACDRAGVWVERKASSCALHYRRAPECETQLRLAARLAVDALAQLRLLEGQCVLEVTARASNKGAALRRTMALPAFEGRLPVAVGDDVTDEDAFLAAAALDGFGVAVGPRPSAAARYALADCLSVDAWLAGLAFGLREFPDA